MRKIKVNTTIRENCCWTQPFKKNTEEKQTVCCLIWSYPRLEHVHTPTQRRPTERETQQRTPQTGGDIHTKKQNCCSSAFAVQSQGGNQLYSNSRLLSGMSILRGCCWPTTHVHVFCTILFPSTVIDLCSSVLLLLKDVHFQDSWSGVGMQSLIVMEPRYKPS